MKKRRPKIVIVGGGITGLMCAHQFLNCADITIIEKDRLGGDFSKGENKYTQRTDRFCALLDSVDVPYSVFFVKNGILLKDRIEKMGQEFFKKSKMNRLERLNDDHFRKTRLLEPPKNLKNSMTEPSLLKVFGAITKISERKAIRTDSIMLLEGLVYHLNGVKRVFSKVVGIGIKSLKVENGETIYFDFLIFTIPLWEIKKIVWWKIGYYNAVRRNILFVQPKFPKVFLKKDGCETEIIFSSDRFAAWDYIYTPYTIGGVVYRMSPFDNGYAIEVNGELTTERKERIYSDLYFLFPDNWHFIKDPVILKGHMLQSKGVDFSKWPKNICAIGRYARWDVNATLDVSLDKITEIKTDWGFCDEN